MISGRVTLLMALTGGVKGRGQTPAKYSMVSYGDGLPQILLNLINPLRENLSWLPGSHSQILIAQPIFVNTCKLQCDSFSSIPSIGR